MERKTTLDTLYLINKGKKTVSLELLIEDLGQTSSFDFILNNDYLLKDHKTNLIGFEIGKNETLHSMVLEIIGTIVDTSKKTNYTSVKIKLDGGMIVQKYVLFKTVESEGDLVDYYCRIEFINPNLI